MEISWCSLDLSSYSLSVIKDLKTLERAHSQHNCCFWLSMWLQVRRLLGSSKPVAVRTANSPDVSDPDIVAQQQVQIWDIFLQCFFLVHILVNWNCLQQNVSSGTSNVSEYSSAPLERKDQAYCICHINNTWGTNVVNGQAQLWQLAQRTTAIPFGRGAFTLATSRPMLTEVQHVHVSHSISVFLERGSVPWSWLRKCWSL